MHTMPKSEIRTKVSQPLRGCGPLQHSNSCSSLCFGECRKRGLRIYLCQIYLLIVLTKYRQSLNYYFYIQTKCVIKVIQREIMSIQRYLLGIDIGSSSVKASLLDADSGQCAGNAFYSKQEIKIEAPQPGFAEQAPEDWYTNAKHAVRNAIASAEASPDAIKAIGIAYQMHGLVCVDSKNKVLRPAIIWCDSRAVDYGQKAFESIGEERCLQRFMNSPSNFTAAKLAWVKENQPAVFSKTAKIMLPGDWLAMRLTGAVQTTASGLSEGILWDFQDEKPADLLIETFGFDPRLLPEVVPTFAIQAGLTESAANDFGLKPGTPVSYRAGDQPNNALSLNILTQAGRNCGNGRDIRRSLRSDRSEEIRSPATRQHLCACKPHRYYPTTGGSALHQ